MTAQMNRLPGSPCLPATGTWAQPDPAAQVQHTRLEPANYGAQGGGCMAYMLWRLPGAIPLRGAVC